MRKHLLGLVLAAGLAGCGLESGPNGPGLASDKERPATSTVAEGLLTPEGLAQSRGSSKSFASLPDRGELVSYGGGRKTRKSGAYTYHPVAISEEHALNAVAGSDLVLQLPDGKPVRLQYERHEEQPDGNWTWIGRGEDGSSAVLTFGEKAVFGQIMAGSETYRVRTDSTGAWMVATDSARLPAGGGRRDDGEDFLAPPGSRVLAAAVAKAAADPGLATDEKGVWASEKAVAFVDVLIGYSAGVAGGNQSAAVTLATNLVAVTNAAYANSGVNMRLRLVYAMRVNFADTSDNRDALQRMTGYDAQSQQPIPVDGAFTALRAARNQYGADVVAFLRAYREPEQNGCGIAWLLGMNQSTITVTDDAEFAYAVVSDGEDRDETDGNTYFCSDYSLAHEIGHVLGQAHDASNADNDGAHAYSFGYRETSATGFHTIMAYPLAGTQVEIPYFANPAVNHVGRPTGVANVSDNARSMNLTMPIVGQFRATVVPVERFGLRNDFNGDGRSDLLFRSDSSGAHVIWRSANYLTKQTIASMAEAGWNIVGTGDFDGNLKTDILFRNQSTGAMRMWRDANSQLSVNLQSAGSDWRVVGIGDFNGDRRSDILLRKPSTGNNLIWLSADGNRLRAVATSGTTWFVAGVGDFNADGSDDILWRNSSSGANLIWRSALSTSSVAVSTVNPRAWIVAGVGDFNGDGRADMFLRNTTNGGNIVWPSALSGSAYSAGSTGLTWTVGAVGDYNGDGHSDVVWRNASSGVNIVWWSGNYATRSALGSAGSAWRLIP